MAHARARHFLYRHDRLRRDRPVVFGRAGDVLGVPTRLMLVALVALLTLPLAAVLRPVLAERYEAGV